ncbi:hypothetical protein KVR01_012519 [Diaporthe batatas]|uniref:uncharacterized protein n=1 Tax=Diaporthe batatas TaxID=748121 RepID=UPI001D058AFC|nr:uncharacterized protein KVR01_012519 [Diaporthe batatas]KAG8157477.1 hypothetical protein KVR01_012519 [Diaporthe batatas]
MTELDGDPNIPLESARRNADSLGINYDALPTMPFWGPLFGKTSDYLKTRVAAKVMTSSASVGRELTQSEKDAMSHHFAKLVITTAYTSPLAVAATFAMERTTRPTFGFPFYTPKPPKFNSQKFPGLPEGRASHLAWQATRVFAWYAASKIVISLFVTSYAISVYSANSGTDNRLEAYRREIARRAGAAMRGGRPPNIPNLPPMQPQQQFPQQSWQDPAPATESVGWASSEQPEKAASTPSPRPWTATQNSQAGRQDSYNQESYVFDDASPVAPSEQSSYPPQGSSQQGGSAWDRIRGQAQAARGQPGSWAKKRQDEMTSRGAQDGTSYTYPTEAEEKVYAAKQAQKEFDEMLERERRGQGR